MEKLFRWGQRHTVLFFALAGSPFFVFTGVYAYVTHKDFLYWLGMTVPPYVSNLLVFYWLYMQIIRAAKAKAEAESPNAENKQGEAEASPLAGGDI